MRERIVAGNWKMNTTADEAKELVEQIISNYSKGSLDRLIIIPPFPFLDSIQKMIEDKDGIEVGAQNCSSEEDGAYTGEVSAKMIRSLGVNYVIIGHSERRSIFRETHQIIKEKVDRALDNGLSPIFCCGEHLDERENGIFFNVIELQLEDSLFHLTASSIQDVVIAYEPVWAIGTGKTASSEEAQEVHAYIRLLIAKRYGEEIAASISILYGGSCKPTNAKELFSKQDVDGGLIGGASLNSNDFLAIASSF